MGDTFTAVATLSSDTAAYQMLAYFALRPQLYFDAVVSVKPTNVSHKGTSVQFNIYTDLAAQTSTLSETVDPDSVAVSDSTVVVTPVEKGAVIKTTALLRNRSFLDINADMANIVGYNAGLTCDTLAATAFVAGDNVIYGGGASTRDTTTSAGTMTANLFRRTRATLVGANVMPTSGSYYWAYLNPDVIYDLKVETGENSWKLPHIYSAPEAIWSGEVGVFEGFRVVETPRLTAISNAGSSPTTTDIYQSIFGGFQACAKGHWGSEGYGPLPQIVLGPKVDALQRIQPIGWKHAVEYKVFRQASLRRIETASSIGS